MGAAINDGGPAFPIQIHVSDVDVKTGMSLRDYFAAKAMQALIQGPDVMENHYEDETNDFVASRAFLIADAMLKARNQ